MDNSLAGIGVQEKRRDFAWSLPQLVTHAKTAWAPGYFRDKRFNSGYLSDSMLISAIRVARVRSRLGGYRPNRTSEPGSFKPAIQRIAGPLANAYQTRDQRPERQRSKAGGHHHPKPDVVEPEDRVVVAPDGAAHVERTETELRP